MRKKAETNQSFLKGTMILSVSVIIVKLIGAVFKIPLNIILGGVGAGYFSAAYELYALGLIGWIVPQFLHL